MKKIMMICLLLIFAFTACDIGKKLPENTTDSTTNVMQTKTANTKIPTTAISTIILYTLPDKIKLDEGDDWNGYYIHSYRTCYYEIDGYIIDLVDHERFNEFTRDYAKKYNSPLQEPREMITKAFIEYFNIPKEDFEKVVQKMIAFCIEEDEDISLEENEVPNPDIIYTFDDEIINEYYRRR